jgi:hypothetical protein
MPAVIAFVVATKFLNIIQKNFTSQLFTLSATYQHQKDERAMPGIVQSRKIILPPLSISLLAFHSLFLSLSFGLQIAKYSEGIDQLSNH